MTTTDQLLERYRSAPSCAEAESALDGLSTAELAGEVALGDLYDELATIAAEEGEFSVAVSAERKAIAWGCDMPELAREMLAWYLLKDGEVDAGEAVFSELLRERGGDDVDLFLLIGNARQDAGATEAALAAFDQALAAAERQGDSGGVARARAERRHCRVELGLPLDADDRSAPRPSPVGLSDARWAIAWFPADERAAALARWPDLEDDLRDSQAYPRRIERELRTIKDATQRDPCVAPLRVKELEAFALREGRDAGHGRGRSQYAAELARTGQAMDWPPGRNDPCWCGSGRKYKRCCATA